MADEIPIAQSVPLRLAGYDETWLRNQIWSNPTSLGLGQLIALSKERSGNSPSRLDILLKDPEDDSMYEVELMLGETDETHIIRTIEYWDNEKRRWPQRQHYAVLVAEQITRRFFNVIHILSNSIPIIAIQVSLIQVNGGKSLFFTKVLDTFEELDDAEPTPEVADRDSWIKRTKWTVDAADRLFAVVAPSLSEAYLSYVKSYIAVNVGRNNYFWFYPRSSDKSLLCFRVYKHLQEKAQQVLDGDELPFKKRLNEMNVTVNPAMIDLHKDAFKKLAALIIHGHKNSD